jgi:hypothetical protein
MSTRYQSFLYAGLIQPKQVSFNHSNFDSITAYDLHEKTTKIKRKHGVLNCIFHTMLSSAFSFEWETEILNIFQHFLEIDTLIMEENIAI